MKNKGKALIIIGLLFLTAALCLTAYNIYDSLRAESSAYSALEQLKDELPAENATELQTDVNNEIPDYLLNPNMEMPVKNKDGIDYIGILTIPTLNLELPVISGWSYPSLKIAPCRYSGSAYLDNMTIAAHNYPSHFGLLINLSEGDDVYFTDVDGNRFHYKVMLVEALPPTDIDKMIKSDSDLSLFTCTLSGQSRVTVRCNRIDEKNIMP